MTGKMLQELISIYSTTSIKRDSIGLHYFFNHVPVESSTIVSCSSSSIHPVKLELQLFFEQLKYYEGVIHGID